MFGKHPDAVVYEVQPFNAGPPLEALAAGQITATGAFFVRNHAEVPPINPADYRLTVAGLVERPRTLSLADLAGFERVTVPATLQCAGNRRNELLALGPIHGELPWAGDAISTATWAGVRLADVLAAAGVAAGAAHVAFNGLDACVKGDSTFPFGGSIPLAKALDPGVLLADTMNGAALLPVHGAPLRVVVPGYIGARSVKWLGEIVLQAEPSANYFQAKAYRLAPRGQPASDGPGEMLGPLFLSALIWAPAAGTRLAAGDHEVSGYAITGDRATITGVELSADGGTTWQLAELLDAPQAGVWCRWVGRVALQPGSVALVARAFDSAGNTMPPSVSDTWNPKGYMNNAWHRVPVVVE